MHGMMTGTTPSGLVRGRALFLTLLCCVAANSAWAEAPAAAAPAPVAAAPDASFYPSAGVAMGGAVGIGRIESAGAGRPGSLRLSLRGGFFQHGAFPENGSNRTFLGELSAGYTIWDGFEAYAALHNTSNSNSEATPHIVQALGDVLLGGKMGGKVGTTDLAADLRFEFKSGIGTDYLKIGNSTVAVRALSATPFTLGGEKFEVLGNLGLIFGRSSDAVDPRMTPALLYGTGYSAYNRLVLGGSLMYHAGRVNPFINLDLDMPFGESATDMRAAQTTLFGVAAKHVGLGARILISPAAGSVDVIVEGAGGKGVAGFARTPPWMVFAGYSFAFDSALYVPPPPPPAPSAPPAAPTTGDLRGSVIDAGTGRPVKDVVAVIDGVPPVATGADGVYLVHNVKAGAVLVRLEREGYKPNVVDSKVTAGSEQVAAQVRLEALPPPAPLALPIAPPPPPAGYIAGQIRSGLNGVPGTIKVIGANTIEVKTSVDGTFSLKLPPGRYELVLLPEGHFARAATAIVNADEASAVVVQTSPRPLTPTLKVDGDKLALTKPISLDEKRVEVAPKDLPALAEVLDFVARDPSKKLVINVHSDSPRKSTGDRAGWTEERAQAIRDALLAQGLPAERVEAHGLGTSQPLVPSTSKTAAQNRRVEFSVIPMPEKKVVPIGPAGGTPAAAPEALPNSDFGGLPPPAL
jgi:outer membrane protein OmpA-like peptidoglycan-associated protein